MIENELEYFEYIKRLGVGKNDIVSSSPKSYISYLNSVSKILNHDINRSLITSKKDILNIINQMKGKRAKSTLLNYKTALNQYLGYLKNEI